MKQSNSRNSAFQLTASQGGWRWQKLADPQTENISTHSLTRRLTEYLAHCYILRNISTHSLTRRLTTVSRMDFIGTGISTHSLTRRLTRVVLTFVAAGGISTHSLTRRLTVTGRTCRCTTRKFQLTASQGGWRYFCEKPFAFTIFQLTASQGGWLTPFIRQAAARCISTHSLTRRLTEQPSVYTAFAFISTHSLTRRLTPC